MPHDDRPIEHAPKCQVRLTYTNEMGPSGKRTPTSPAPGGVHAPRPRRRPGRSRTPCEFMRTVAPRSRPRARGGPRGPGCSLHGRGTPARAGAGSHAYGVCVRDS